MLSKESWPPSLPGGKGGGRKRAGGRDWEKTTVKNLLVRTDCSSDPQERWKKGEASGNASSWVYSGEEGLYWPQSENPLHCAVHSMAARTGIQRQMLLRPVRGRQQCLGNSRILEPEI